MQENNVCAWRGNSEHQDTQLVVCVGMQRTTRATDTSDNVQAEPCHEGRRC